MDSPALISALISAIIRTSFYLAPTIAGLIFGVSVQAREETEIPHIEALDRSGVELDRLDDPLDYAMILGNGDLNGLVWTENRGIVLTVTKNDVWDARLDSKLDPPLPTIARIKELAAGDWKDRTVVLPIGTTWQGPDSYDAHPYPCPRACARVRIDNSEHNIDAPPQYAKASIDIRRAVAHIEPQGQIAAATNAIDLRALGGRNAFLITLPKPYKIGLESIVSSDLPSTKRGRDGKTEWLVQRIPGDEDWPGLTFAVALAQDPSGLQAAVSVVTSREHDDPRAAAVQMAQRTCGGRPAELVADHEARWRKFWSRSGIEMDDPLLESVWYRSLYFLRCVSKPGVVCPALFAGLINDTPAWHGDYHTNYNLQQTFWSAYAANQIALTEPYDRLINDYRPRARWLAKKIYDCGGAYYPHVLFAYEPSHPDQCKSPGNRQYIHHEWGFTIGLAGFTVQPIWWRYKHDPDPAYLKETAYPAVSEVAEFYADFIDTCDKREGAETVILGPTVSPEHWGWTERFHRNRDCSFDLAMARFLFAAAIEGAETLKQDAESAARWRKAASQLPAYPLHGQGEEQVVVDVAGAPPITYTIPVPATPVFPGDQITFQSPAAQRALFKRTIRNIRHNGNNAPLMLASARLRLDMVEAYECLRTDLADRVRPNGTLSFNRLIPPRDFNNFGHYTEMFGAAQPVTETLMQSVGDVVRLFPGLPAKRPAAFTRLRAQGGFLISARHDGERIAELSIESTRGGVLRLQTPWTNTQYKSKQENTWSESRTDSEGITTIETQVHQTLSFRPSVN